VTVDRVDQPGVYLGTTGGEVYAAVAAGDEIVVLQAISGG
jgi:hypothetical protein